MGSEFKSALAESTNAHGLDGKARGDSREHQASDQERKHHDLQSVHHEVGGNSKDREYNAHQSFERSFESHQGKCKTKANRQSEHFGAYRNAAAGH